MPTCKQCGKEFNRQRDTKSFCGATCRSLFRYYKAKKNKDSVQEDTVQDVPPVDSVQESPKQAKDSVKINSVQDNSRSEWCPKHKGSRKWTCGCK